MQRLPRISCLSGIPTENLRWIDTALFERETASLRQAWLPHSTHACILSGSDMASARPEPSGRAGFPA